MEGDTSMEEKIVLVLNEMSEYLSIAQMKKLQESKLVLMSFLTIFRFIEN